MFCHNFSFLEQVSKQTFKFQSFLGCIIYIFSSNELLILIYKVCFRPLLKYSMFILSVVHMRDELMSESVQRSYTLQILGSDCTINYKSICNILELDTLWKRRLKLNLIFFSEIFNKLSFASNEVIQYTEAPSYTIHNSLSLKTIPFWIFNYINSKFLRPWNSLPQSHPLLTEPMLTSRKMHQTCLHL